ncbi:MarR family winged helix-turn-helix transcriptional regulator [Rhizobium rhizoryzae]|jgi:DNA-binding MarR family transcriptional regulator|uniref:MarR family winged helix-turn-helix transcriptional regulator n=1 Tax=Rhizobium rhizoryzae TaxID=451876 RepID=UPI002897E17F|nr:MarR family transcriptional regulator [Rhizobium rhizoryzae]
MKKAEPTSDIALDQMLCFAVYKAEQAFNRVYRAALEPLGLTYPQFLTMRLLWRSGSSSVGEISEQLGLDSGTITPLIKRLTNMGLVRKERRADDERRVDIHLTQAGRELEAKSGEVLRCIGQALQMDLQQANVTLQTINHLTSNLTRAANVRTTGTDGDSAPHASIV